MTKFLRTSLALSALLSSVYCLPASLPTGPGEGSKASYPTVGWQTVPAGRALPHVPITYPKHGEIWLGAEHHNVTWDTNNVPSNKAFSNTAIFLAQKGQVVSSAPLASNFSLLDGRVEIQAPKQVNGDGFQVILFVEHGSNEDRGSYSSDYTIVSPDLGSGSGYSIANLDFPDRA